MAERQLLASRFKENISRLFGEHLAVVALLAGAIYASCRSL